MRVNQNGKEMTVEIICSSDDSIMWNIFGIDCTLVKGYYGNFVLLNRFIKILR